MTFQITVEGQASKYLTAPTYTLGRAAECDVRLPENDRLVSREHARLERDEGGEWWLVDLSTNGTFVNGERMSGRRALREGDQISIGRTQISFASLSLTPAPPEQAPARTLSITVGELRAGIREIASRSPVAHSALQAAPQSEASSLEPPPASAHLEAPPAASSSASGLAAVPAPLAALAPRQSEIEAPTLVPLAPGEAAAAPTASELLRESLGANSASNGTPAAMQGETSTGLSGSEDGSSQDGERMKQCTGCGHQYALEQNKCPACGDSSFRIRGSAPAIVLVTAPVTVPASEIAPAPENAPAPDLLATRLPVQALGQPLAQSLVAEATPFDRTVNSVEPVAAALPVAPGGVASGLGQPVGMPKPVVPPTLADWPPVNLDDVTFGRPDEPSPRPGLSLAGLGCGSAMLLSLFLPWALSTLGSISYIALCQASIGGASRAGRGERASTLLTPLSPLSPLSPSAGAVTSEPRLLLLPALATVVTLGAAIWMLTSQHSRARGSALALVCGGTLGLMGAGVLHASFAGPGRWIFAAASVGAMVAGLGRFAALRSSR